MKVMLSAAMACCVMLAGCERGPSLETKNYDDGISKVTETKTRGLFGTQTCRVRQSKLPPYNVTMNCD